MLAPKAGLLSVSSSVNGWAVSVAMSVSDNALPAIEGHQAKPEPRGRVRRNCLRLRGDRAPKCANLRTCFPRPPARERRGAGQPTGRARDAHHGPPGRRGEGNFWRWGGRTPLRRARPNCHSRVQVGPGPGPAQLHRDEEEVRSPRRRAPSLRPPRTSGRLAQAPGAAKACRCDRPRAPWSGGGLCRGSKRLHRRTLP